ncbi:MAG: hypothetical protein AUJ74_02430 [Candidatus Omnitrophica bacterium CG1_02_44_16]|nr:MAG: hypothetical protein AUJ74_02430 [Candidatus Omnitrophica bacterium CG1_02_44_16]PIY82528.1 MAG: hypothetical protein COY78_06765 [Candidatus Omnitrophica bacterium CG_4_10_14_0_8_um_filter_44_12]PIZ84360.1 MAG: hypothetical protein COX96_04210 [Candidatus Omnitrophica bacterium CG_4_10_14_0_2_um_filter_44_9]
MWIPKLIKELRLVLVISRDVCRAALKERVMYGFLLIAFLFILMANVPFVVKDPKVFGPQRPEASALQIGFMSINVFTILISIFVSLNTLQSFFSRERLGLLLSKPVRRVLILEGAILGLFEMVFLNWFLMTAGVWLVIFSQTREWGFYIWTGMSVTALMALLYVALVVFFYCIIPNTMAGIMAVLLIIAGFGVPMARQAISLTLPPGFVSSSLAFGLDCIPQINSLWGVSMQYLKFFNLNISATPIIFQTLAVIFVLNIISVLRFRRFCQF